MQIRGRGFLSQLYLNQSDNHAPFRSDWPAPQVRVGTPQYSASALEIQNITQHVIGHKINPCQTWNKFQV